MIDIKHFSKLSDKSMMFYTDRLVKSHKIDNYLTVYLITTLVVVIFLNKKQIFSDLVIDVISISAFVLYAVFAYLKENYFFHRNEEYIQALREWGELKGRCDFLYEIKSSNDIEAVFDRQCELLEQQAEDNSSKAMILSSKKKLFK